MLAKQLWFMSTWGIRTENFRFLNTKDWCLKLLDGVVIPRDCPSFDEFRIFAAVFVETIWKERNSIIHGGAATGFEAVSHSITSSMSLYLQVLLHEESEPLLPHPVRWTPPPPTWVKINVDGVVRQDRSIVAAVARGASSDVLAIHSKEVPCSEPLVAEAAALLFGMDMAIAKE